eukprot:4453744-Ditylum_brightwellii.AAC.1
MEPSGGDMKWDYTSMAGTSSSLVSVTTPNTTPVLYNYSEQEVECINVLLEAYLEQSDLSYRMASRGRTPALIYQMIQDLIAPTASLNS